MKDFKNKVAVITGGAGGVGRAIGLDLAREGAKIVVADIEQGAIDQTVSDIKALGAEAIGVYCDVSKLDSLKAAEAATVEAFGDYHLVFANAGIGAGEFGMLWDYDDNDWNWAFNVNVWGVINTIRAFMPRLSEKNVESHFVITGSANGAVVKLPYTPIYTCTKAAVQAITENLYFQMRMLESNVQINALMPGPHSVATGIFNSGRNRPEDLPDNPNKPDFGMKTADDMVEMMGQAGIKVEITQPEEVAQTALQGLRDNQFWIMPLPEAIEEAIQKRHESIMNRTPPPLVELDG
ncbi:MAG: SDR family NAD(P)-dependent oxidoreductase [Gammaproteobacteria bacterium]|nr:SDR family NAD(P)-dependent oxidoreductase [Gammaproteobacteria bacterium]